MEHLKVQRKFTDTLWKAAQDETKLASGRRHRERLQRYYHKVAELVLRKREEDGEEEKVEGEGTKPLRPIAKLVFFGDVNPKLKPKKWRGILSKKKVRSEVNQ